MVDQVEASPLGTLRNRLPEQIERAESLGADAVLADVFQPLVPLREGAALSGLPAPTTSRLTIRRLIRRAVGRVLLRHIRAVAREEAAAVVAASGDRDSSSLAERVAALERHRYAVDERERSRGFRPWFSELDFGAEFRGERTELLDRSHELADIVAAPGGPVLDLGCGRGEMLELLSARGVQAWGVELDEGLVDFCQSLGLDARLEDATAVLDDLEDGALGGVSLIQVVEHLTPQQLVDLVPVLARKVRKGGVVLAETVNATSPYVYTRAFYTDPTHTNPVHPAYLSFLFRQAGFQDVEIRWRSPVPDEDKLGPIDSDSELAGEINQRIEQINRFLFVAQDYALVATR